MAAHNPSDLIINFTSIIESIFMRIYFILFLLAIILSGCQTEKDKLKFDEVVFVEYQVALLPTGTGNLDLGPFSKNRIQDPEEYVAKELNLSMPYLIDKINYRVFIPLREVKISSNGQITYFQKRSLDSTRNGYFTSSIPSSSIRYFNSQLDSVKSGDIDSVYYKEHPGLIYDGSYYFLSFKKDTKEVFSYTYYPDDASKEIKRFVKFIKYLIRRTKFEPAEDKNQFEEINKRVFNSKLSSPPIRIISEAGNDYVPSVQELKRRK